MKEKIPNILYHYCSVDTLISIAENKTLRLSEIAKSNDSMECQWLEKKIIPDLITELCDSLYEKRRIKNNDISKDSFTSAVFSIVARGSLSKFYHGEDGFIDTRLALAICFSQKQDLLSQWRGYANDGYGVAIGFNTDLFKRFTSDNKFAPVNLKKVIYNKRDQENCIKKFVRAYIRKYIQLDAVPQKELIDLLSNALIASVYIKNPAFVEEAEWRFFVAHYIIKDYSEYCRKVKSLNIGEEFKDLEVSSKGEKMVFYADLQLDKLNDTGDKLQWISEIVIGPKCKLSERDIHLLLDRYGWNAKNVNIVTSKATYI